MVERDREIGMREVSHLLRPLLHCRLGILIVNASESLMLDHLRQESDASEREKNVKEDGFCVNEDFGVQVVLSEIGLH